MRIGHGHASGGFSQMRTETFTDEVWADPVLASEDGVTVNTVIFTPGARTYWHRHEVGQVLQITHGEGRLQSADGTGRRLVPGDIAHIPAGEVHWHGAAPGSLMSHLAISIGATEWMHEVSDEDYESAVGAKDD